LPYVDRVKLLVCSEEIAEEPMFVEPAPTAVEVNDVAVTG